MYIERTVPRIMLIVFILITGSCKKSVKQTDNAKYDSISLIIPTIDTLSHIFYSMPDPDEILDEIFTEQIELKTGLVYPIEQTDKLFEYNAIALNLGVLMADMTYLMLQNKSSLSIEYFKTILQLGDQMDLKIFHNRDILRKLEVNIDNKDALLAVFKESFSKIRFELDYSNRSKDLALIYTGAMVETLYLAIENTTKKNDQLISKNILEQYSILNSLAEFMNEYNYHTDIAIIADQLDSIKFYMDNSILHETKVSAQKNEDNILHIKGGGIEINTIESFDSVKRKVFELRSIITEQLYDN